MIQLNRSKLLKFWGTEISDKVCANCARRPNYSFPFIQICIYVIAHCVTFSSCYTAGFLSIPDMIKFSTGIALLHGKNITILSIKLTVCSRLGQKRDAICGICVCRPIQTSFFPGASTSSSGFKLFWRRQPLRSLATPVPLLVQGWLMFCYFKDFYTMKKLGLAWIQQYTTNAI